MLYHFRVQPRCNAEFRSRRNRLVALLGCENRARPDQHIRVCLYHLRDHLVRTCRAECNLGAVNAAVIQRLRQIYRVVGILQLNHRDNARTFHLL